MKRILVTGCGGAASGNFIQSLRMSDEKYYIVGTDTSKYNIHLSRADVSYISSPVTDESYLDNLNNIIKKENIDMVHAQPDPEVLHLSRNRKKVNAILELPTRPTIEICQDKVELANYFTSQDIPVPILFNHAPRDELKGKWWLRAIRGAGAKASLLVTSMKEVVMWVDYWEKHYGLGYDDFMMSEYLPGREYAWSSIWKDGQLITSQARERVEYLMGHLTPSGQTSSPSVARTIHNEDVNQICTDAVMALDCELSGIMCIDLKENANKVPCITEVNAGRFFTTSYFLTRAGCNMPHYYIKSAMGESIPKLDKYNCIDKNIYWIRGMDNRPVMRKNLG